MLGTLLFALAVRPGAQTVPGVGRIDVMVTDRAGMVLPGALVTVASGAEVRHAVSGPDGRIVMNGLPLDRRYVVSAELAGFDTEAREFVRPATEPAMPVVLSVRLGCGATLCPVWVEPSIDPLRREGMGVAVVRITQIAAPTIVRNDLFCATAAFADVMVLDVVTSPDHRLSRGQHLRVALGTDQTAPGDYLVDMRFVPAMDRYQWGGMLLQPVIDGRVDPPFRKFPFKSATPIGEAARKLRAALVRGTR
jgi:hypothetical protein